VKARSGIALCIAAAVAAGGVLACGSTQRPIRQRMTTKEIVETAKPAIVRIESDYGKTPTGEPKLGVGTGFVVDASGLIATNLHVIQGTPKIEVTFLNGAKMPVRGIVAVDPDRDLAILRVDASELPALRLGDSDAVEAGDHVIAIGNPLGVLDYTVSDGLISSVRLVTDDLTILQISAPISEGSSGGPLFNNYGEVIGVATMIATTGQNLNFGVPSKYLQPLLASRDGELTPQEFASRFNALAGGPRRLGPGGGSAPADPDAIRIERRVPSHDISALDGCSEEALLAVFQGIGDAIDIGAPLYNQGNHEACFRVYEGLALRFERELECPLVREALGQGLLRAQTKSTFTEKAWAMRDAFDGILLVIERRARQLQRSP
jgi:serine protease Do